MTGVAAPQGWRTYADAPAFLGACQGFLMSNEALNNMILSSAARYIQNPPKQQPLFAVYVGDGGTAGGALLAAEDRPILTTDLPVDAGAGLRDLLRNHPRMDIMAPEPGAAIVAQALQSASGRTLRSRGFQMHLWTKAPRPESSLALPPGQMRRAWIEDKEKLLPWMPDSALASGQVETPEQSAKFLNDMIVGRKLFVWSDQGEIVSMAAFTGPTPNGVRLISVYTPPEKRKRGYARALVLRLSELQQQFGKSFCVLFTDPTNLTSNKIYREIGYQPLALFTYYFPAPGAGEPTPTGGAG